MVNFPLHMNLCLSGSCCKWIASFVPISSTISSIKKFVNSASGGWAKQSTQETCDRNRVEGAPSEKTMLLNNFEKNCLRKYWSRTSFVLFFWTGSTNPSTNRAYFEQLKLRIAPYLVFHNFETFIILRVLSSLWKMKEKTKLAKKV